MDTEKLTLQVNGIENDDTDLQGVGGSGVTRASSTVQPSPTEDQRHESSSSPIGHMTPVVSETETLREDSDSEDASQQEAGKLPIWFGDLARSGFNQSYLSLRDQLSDAAYRGDFDRAFSILVEVQQVYRQSWANAPRLSRTPQQSSGWTPLHQAALMGASKDCTVHLIEEFGALRLLRTAWTDSAELPYRDMTSAEIARSSGFSNLYSILAPTIYHCVPSAVLATLQAHFHDLIRFDLRESTHELANLRLPDLVVLTELKVPMMWFPLKPRGLNRVRGYMYRLDGRELLVKVLGISQPIRDERPAKCPILSCEYYHRGFAREYDKQRHVLTHYKGVLVCPFCPVSGSTAERSFDGVDVFKRHLRSIHSAQKLPLNSRDQSQSQGFSASARYLLSQCRDAWVGCAICNSAFANAQELYEHLDDCIIWQLGLQEEFSEPVEQRIQVLDHQNARIYRISEGGVREIEEAIIFGV